ncbi:MAG: hypothetical protein KAI79_12380 [Bacteroidales bacterium]|nr:hypothetical protein [Bacteroidales bacterium]
MTPLKILGQNGVLKEFKEMHNAERFFAIRYPKSAIEAFKLSKLAQKKTSEIKTDIDLDADDNGGQVDAFRHAYWMAILTIRIGEKKARKLGLAHEKSNSKDYERLKLEEGMIPDFKASFMDLKNNEEGIRIGLQYPESDEENLIPIIKKEILEGRLWKLKKDSAGNYYDYFNKLIPFEKWHGKWMNDKTLVPSNFVFYANYHQ